MARSAVHITVSEMPRQIPAGSIVELEPAKVDGLKFGDVLYANRQDRKILCRFLRTWSSNGEPMVMLGEPGKSAPLVLPASAIVGKVARVSIGDEVREPNKEASVMRLLPRLLFALGKQQPFL